MARFPTFEEYEKTGRFQDGIKRCNDLLKKHPKDVQLLTVKLQLLYADKQEGKPILDRLLTIEPHIQDIVELYQINAAVVNAQRNIWPRPRTVGPEVSKLWENAVKTSASVNHKLELLMQRFESSVEADYMVDAQQALIQLKALQPKNRAIYMAHAAVTQLISGSKDDMQSRLALMLAKKAVTEEFDEEKDLDCRVPGQIFALQGSTKDLESIQGRRFGESKQAYDAVRRMSKAETNGSTSVPETRDPSAVPAADWLAAEITSLKARFAQLIKASAGLEAMLTFAANAIRLFHTSIQSMPTARSRTKGDACFVAISTLVKAYELSQNLSHLLVSAHLAELLLQLDPYIHEARLILVYLYTRLGLGSLAIRYFDSLSIKEVQFDTVGHALFTGLSHLHPHQLCFGKKEERNPMTGAKNAAQVYKRCEDKLSETEAGVLSNGQTGMIFDLHELRDTLRSSVTKRIIFLEIRRQARLMLHDSSWHTQDLGPKCVANWIETTDNRDFAATFDYGYNVEKALHDHNATLPGKNWMLYGLAADVAWCLASSKDADSPIDDPETLIKELQSDLPDIRLLTIEDGQTHQRSINDSEYLAGDLACQVLKLVMLVKAKSAADNTKAQIETVERAIDRLNISALCEINDVYSERLRDHYAYFDALKVVERACPFALKASSDNKQELEKLQQRVKDCLTVLRAHAEEQRKLVKEEHIRAEMVKSNEEVFASLQAFGIDSLNDFCQAIVESAEQGWSGVANLKVKL